MRLWSLHPRYFDSKGLTAAWREAAGLFTKRERTALALPNR